VPASAPAAGFEPDATVFMAPPQAEAFRLPESAPETNMSESGMFGTVLIASPLLIEQRGGGLPGAHHRLGLLTTIGRTADNQVVVPQKDVSRRHAEIAMTSNGYVLKDLKSPNGTFVNGTRITEHVLQDGDRITVGETVFIYQKP
jgi:pSer/pThr/pTyr-binding forkhead associated (FHA) protein